MSVRPLVLTIGVCILTILTGQSSLLLAVELAEGDKVILPDKISHSIKIDGELDEPPWKLPAINKEFKTISPHYGDPLGQETKVWAAYEIDFNIISLLLCF